MPGIVSYKWKLTNLTNNTVQDVEIYNEWFTYLFNTRGDYKLTLELIDSNGNKNIISRNIISIVKESGSVIIMDKISCFLSTVIIHSSGMVFHS